MAIIVVNTLDDALPPDPVIPRLAEGVPLDFEYFAVVTHGRPVEAAVKRAIEDNERALGSSGSESIAAREAVIGGSLLSHPSLYADSHGISNRERIPKAWLSIVNERSDLIAASLASVGRIQLYHFVPKELRSLGYEIGLIIGTGFLVAPNIVMTNRHVAILFAQARAGLFPFIRDNPAEREPLVVIDFGGLRDETSDTFRVERVLYVAPGNRPDVALLRIASYAGRKHPEPLALQATDPKTYGFPRKTFVCGYPTTDPYEPRVPVLFRTLGVKRVSLGEVLGIAMHGGHKRLFHSCTTLGGSSGSPLVDFETGTVWGLHYWGRVVEGDVAGNVAEPMWRVCSQTPVRAILGSAATRTKKRLPRLQQPPSVVAIKQEARPVMFVSADDIAPDQPFPSDWFARDSDGHRHIRAALAATGQVQYEDPPADGWGPLGSVGFLVAPARFLTLWFVRDKDRVPADKMVVEFANTAYKDPPLRFRIGEVQTLRMGTTALALVKLVRRPGQHLPKPLAVHARKPSRSLVGEDVFVVGHPQLDARNEPSVFGRVFPPPYGVKRLALGRVVEPSDSGEFGVTGELLHDCSTSGGDGGAPLVSVSSGRVLGIHFAGMYLQANAAIPIWPVTRALVARGWLSRGPDSSVRGPSGAGKRVSSRDGRQK